MTVPFQGRFLGILGGMGPLAGASFLTRLTQLTPVTEDQEHLPTILWSDPRIPSRTVPYSDPEQGPLPWMRNALQHLEGLGAQALVIPCNTAHIWYTDLQASVSIPVLHIVQAVQDDLSRYCMCSGRIGLLATAATLKSGLYQTHLSRDGYECILPDARLLQQACLPAIALVKQNQLDQASQVLLPAIEMFVQQHQLDAVVLGCTELPLALPQHLRSAVAVPVLDSIDALAKAALSWYGGSINHA